MLHPALSKRLLLALFSAALPLAAHAQTISTVYSFHPIPASQYGGVALAPDGSLYAGF